MKNADIEWEAVPCDCGYKGCNSYVVKGLHHSDGRMEKKDAVLIAAAWKLLEACERISRNYKKDQSQFEKFGLSLETEMYCIDQAIAKAKDI